MFYTGHVPHENSDYKTIVSLLDHIFLYAKGWSQTWDNPASAS